MLGFIESPIALIALFLIILICFGPQKVPEIANQIGRALGEFKRATSSFQQSMRVDEYDSSYRPTNYDSYGNPTDFTSTSSVPDEDITHHLTLEAAPEPPRGDFAASALADSDNEYTYGISSPSGGAKVVTSDPPPAAVIPKAADSTVARNSIS